MKEGVDVAQLCSLLPEEYQQFFQNKQVLKDKDKFFDLYKTQKDQADMAGVKKFILILTKICSANIDLDEAEVLRKKAKERF